MELSNENEEHSAHLSVKLKVIYIFDDHMYKKYELLLRPGEYSYYDIIGRIKEKVQTDRFYIKLCKRTFILVDLYDNSIYG